MAKCRVCGAPHKSCGPSSASLIASELYTKPEESNVAMHEYNQTIRGLRTTVLLSDEDAERAGLTASDRVTNSTYVAPEPAPADPEDVGEDVAPLTAQEIAELREDLPRLRALRDEVAELRTLLKEDDVNGDPDDTGDQANQGDGDEQQKQQDAPANKAARAPRNKAAAPAATK